VPDRAYRVAVADGIGGSAPPTRAPAAKPHWWAVLAVTLSLIALVTAVSASSSHRRAERAGVVGAHRSGQRSVPASGGAGTAGDVAATTGASRTVSTPTAGAPEPPETTTSVPIELVTGPMAVPTGSVPPSPPTTTTSLPSSSPPPPLITYPGYLEYPDNVSATYGLMESTGTLEVSASWNTPDDLELSAQCGQGNPSTLTGPSGLATSVGSDGSTCRVVLSQLDGDRSTLSYQLSVALSPT